MTQFSNIDNLDYYLLKRQVLMVQLLSINFFFCISQFLLGFSKVSVFCHSVYVLLCIRVIYGSVHFYIRVSDPKKFGNTALKLLRLRKTQRHV
jgi:hypothetical protein